MRVKIGLETHVQLNSESKIFCGCRNPVNLKKEPGPNTLTCPTCLGLPGSKPVVNRKVVEMGTKAAKALGCRINPETHFSRKTYFYPDLAKNFQTTQYEIPLAKSGFLNLKKRRVRIRRLHIEEDPAKITHVGGMGGPILLDYNRSGVPLAEIVTEPDLATPEEARLYIQKLEIIIEYLGVYDPVSKAVIKSDANVSINGGQRVEIKNITGSKEIEEALKQEISRQEKFVKSGSKVVMETRMWDPAKGRTEEMRGKEEEEEYGYIFEPDLPVLELKKDFLDKIKIPELPDQKLQKFVRKHGVKPEIAESIISELGLAELFEELAEKIDPKLASTWIAGYLKKTLNWNDLKFRESGIKKEWVLDLLNFFKQGRITDRNAEMAIRKMVAERRPAKQIIKKYKLEKTELDLEKILKGVLSKNPKAVEDYKKGEKKAIEFLVGQVMRETKGQVDAKEIRKKLLKLL